MALHDNAGEVLSRDDELPSPIRATPEGSDRRSPCGLRAQQEEVSINLSPVLSRDRLPSGNRSLPNVSSPTHLENPLHGSPMLPIATTTSTMTTLSMPSTQPLTGFGDFDLFIDNINGAYGNGLSSFYVEEPILPYPPAPLFPTYTCQAPGSASGSAGSNTAAKSANHLFDEFAATFPSFESSSSFKARQEPWKVTQEDWEDLLVKVQKFMTVIPEGFLLPSRHTLTRYITTYFTGFHRHLPFIHLPTFSGQKCPVELILAMASIGAISAFDHQNAIMLFRTSLAISRERLHHRKERRRRMIFHAETEPPISAQNSETLDEAAAMTITEQSGPHLLKEQNDKLGALPLAQALLILMAMATWENSEAIFDEAIEIQHTLVNYVRSENLLEPQASSGSAWKIWIQEEGFRRTIAVIYCFFNFHTIVYDLPPPILSTELNIQLPSRENDWEAQTEEKWLEARGRHELEPLFQPCFSSLFSSQTDKVLGYCSSLGGYILILALIQHIYLLRTTSKLRSEAEQALSPTDISEVECALRNWQSGWNQDPESSLGPASPLGPISFNSTALLRMAYIRLNADVGPWRALNSQDPHEIAMSIHRSPNLTTNPRLSRAVLYSAHALSIPVKIGVNIVTHNQAFSWSLQHSLCALECAFIISKWLIAIQRQISGGVIDEEEARLHSYIMDMVTEAEVGEVARSPNRDLCTRVIRIWARILSGKAVWNVVRMIGKILHAYAEILEKQAVQ